MTRRREDPSKTVITELVYQGRTVDCCVSEKGIFFAVISEDRIDAPSLDRLKDKIKQYIDKLGKIEVPVTVVELGYDDPPEFEDGLLLRLRRGHPVVRYADGREDTLQYRGTLLRRLAPAEQQALSDAWAAQKAAEAHYAELLEAATADAGELLRVAAEGAK